jgi:hypothetical protein
MTQATESGPCGCRINPLQSLFSIHARFVIHPPLIPHPGEAIEEGTGRQEV